MLVNVGAGFKRDVLVAALRRGLQTNCVNDLLEAIQVVEQQMWAKCFGYDDTPVVVPCGHCMVTGQYVALGDHDVSLVWTIQDPTALLPSGRVSTAGLLKALRQAGCTEV